MTSDFTVEHIFSIGSILSRTFSTLFGNPQVFFGLAAITIVPTFLGDLLDESAVFLSVVILIIGAVVNMLIQGCIAYATYQFMRNEDVGLGESVSAALPHLLPLLGVAVITGLGISLGSFLFIIPGIILSCIWAVAMQACIVEQLGVLDSISRSADLTRGYRLQIFVMMVLVGIVTYGLIPLGVYAGTSESGIVWSLLNSILLMLPVAFNSVMSAIIYYDLRAVKEGVDLDHLVDVFE